MNVKLMVKVLCVFLALLMVIGTGYTVISLMLMK